mgnify:CR=1 FL=1
MKNKVVNGLYAVGSLIGIFGVGFRVIDLVSYSEMKIAVLVALALLGTSLAFEKIAIKELTVAVVIISPP